MTEEMIGLADNLMESTTMVTLDESGEEVTQEAVVETTEEQAVEIAYSNDEEAASEDVKTESDASDEEVW